MLRPRLTLLAAAASVTAACAGRSTPAPEVGPAAPCPAAPSAAAGDRHVPAAGLAGGHRLTLHALRPQHPGRRVVGTLWLWPTSERDSSARHGRRAAPGDTARAPFFGATDVNLWDLGRRGPSGEAALRAWTDPVYPGVLVTAMGGGAGDRAWSRLTLWVGSEVNRRDGVQVLDGGGFYLLVTGRDSGGLRGRWGPAGIVVTDTGWFCAARRP